MFVRRFFYCLHLNLIMCYYFSQTKDAESLQKKFNSKLKQPELFTVSAQYNGFEFPDTPVIINSEPDLIQMAGWGLIPDSSGDKRYRTYTLNAKIETIKEKPAYRNLVRNRCLIICDAFYEWQHRGKEKVKYKIGFDDELFALAGIYNQIDDRIYYSMVTTEAQGIMREIHNVKHRMPYALKTDLEFEAWLKNEEVQPRSDFSAEAPDDSQLKLF